MDDFDFSAYENLRAEGRTAHQINAIAKEDGHQLIQRIIILRRLFGLSLKDAKEVAESRGSVDQNVQTNDIYFPIYDTLRAQGKRPKFVNAKAKADGHGVPERIKILRRLFNLSLEDAKQIAEADETSGWFGWLKRRK